MYFRCTSVKWINKPHCSVLGGGLCFIYFISDLMFQHSQIWVEHLLCCVYWATCGDSFDTKPWIINLLPVNLLIFSLPHLSGLSCSNPFSKPVYSSPNRIEIVSESTKTLSQSFCLLRTISRELPSHRFKTDFYHIVGSALAFLTMWFRTNTRQTDSSLVSKLKQ